MLQGRGIVKSFGSNTVLRGVDIEVRPGAVTLLVGPSGSGKTTLLKSLALLDPPDIGIVALEDEVFEFPRPRSKHRFSPPWPTVTVVFQQHFLWPHLTIGQNILLPLGDLDDTERVRYAELIEIFDMGPFLHRHPNEVSIGQRQRAALARALVLNPKFVLMDEITAALDVEQIHKIFLHLLELRERGIGILLITHMLGLARALLNRADGDELVFLDEGRVLAAGGLDMLDNPTHPRLAEFLSKMRFTS